MQRCLLVRASLSRKHHTRKSMVGMRSALISTLLLLLAFEPACCSKSNVPIFVNTWAFTHATEAGWIALTNSSSKARHLDAIVEVLGRFPHHHSALLAIALIAAVEAVVPLETRAHVDCS